MDGATELDRYGFPGEGREINSEAVFLVEMEQVVPRSLLEGLIEPFYPKKGNGGPLMPLCRKLRIHFLQQWLGYPDPAMEDPLHDVPPLRHFTGLDAFEYVMTDKSAILRFRHLLEKNELAGEIFAEGNSVLLENGLSMKRGTVVDSTLIAAPSSTKNKEKKRDPEMKQTKKGNQWNFGMKAHIGVDAESDLIYTAECTTANVADITIMEACLHGDKSIALSDRGNCKTNQTINYFEKEGELAVLTPTKKPKGAELTDQQKAFNRMLSLVRTIVEHPFRVVKYQFYFREGSLSRTGENTGQIVMLFALVNLWLSRKRLLPLLGEVRP